MTKDTVVLFEDSGWNNLYPISLSRPSFECRAGGASLGRRLAARLAQGGAPRIDFLCRPMFRPQMEREYPGHIVNQPPAGDAVFLNGRLLCLRQTLETLLDLLQHAVAIQIHGELAAVRLSGEAAGLFHGDLARALEEGEAAPIPPGVTTAGPPEGVRMARHLWDLVAWNPDVIEDDYEWARERPRSAEPDRAAGAQILGRENVIVREGVRLDPGSILDARSGPILVGEGAHVQHQAVVLGPAYIGPRTRINMGARLYDGVSLGPSCKVGGEVEAVILQGYGNKQHDGFLGHAYVGAWTNLGAGTNNSDLKNNYGAVRVRLPGGDVDTGEQFVGLFMGDHSKTAIGTRLNTGTAVGYCCNLFGEGFPPKHLPSFSWSWGAGGNVYDVEKALAVARAVMGRRHVEMEPADEVVFRHIFENREQSG